MELTVKIEAMRRLKNVTRLDDIAMDKACSAIIRLQPCELEKRHKKLIYNQIGRMIPLTRFYLERYIHRKDEHRLWMIMDLFLRLIEHSRSLGFERAFRHYCRNFQIQNRCELILAQRWIWNTEPHDGAHIIINFIQNINSYSMTKRIRCPLKCNNYCDREPRSRPRKGYPYLLFNLCTYCCE